MTIVEENKRALYAKLYYLLHDRSCEVYRINGIANHVHIFFNLHPTQSLASLMGVVKRESSKWAHRHPELFPDWEGWSDEYSALGRIPDQFDRVVNYIRNQEEHHRTVGYDEEIERLLRESGVSFGDISHFD